jgi:hypothetical protein
LKEETLQVLKRIIGALMSMLYGDGQIRGYNQADRRSDLVPSYLGIDALG